MSNDLGTALRECFVSPNVPDDNGEAANVVDTTAAIARALRAVAHGGTTGATGLELVAMALARHGDPSISSALYAISESIDDLAAAVREPTP